MKLGGFQLYAVAAIAGLALFAGAFTVQAKDRTAARAVPPPASEMQQFWIEQVVDGLALPMSIAWLPDGDMLIAERYGAMRRVHQGRLDPRPVDGVPPVYKTVYDGFREIILDPGFAKNRLIYLLVSEGTFQERYGAVYRARYDPSGLREVKRIFRTKDANSGISLTATRMILLADGTLLVAVAEDHKDRAQRLDSHFGKILRIRTDGSAPPDNPFVKTAGALPEIYSYGHRVPLGLYQDPRTREIWEVEAGERGGDELNRLKPGANYGWPKASWSFTYANNGGTAPAETDPDVEDPLFLWMPSVTPAGLSFVESPAYPGWRGDAIIGNLSAKGIERLKLRGGAVVLRERLLTEFAERIREVKFGPDGYLYVLSDNVRGRLLRLRPGMPKPADMAHVALPREEQMTLGGAHDIFEVMKAKWPEGSAAAGRQTFIMQCAACHSIGTDIAGGKIGPDLAGLFKRQAGRLPGYGFSRGMSGSLIPWSEPILNAFLRNPQEIFPGTSMSTPPIADDKERGDLIAFFKQAR